MAHRLRVVRDLEEYGPPEPADDADLMTRIARDDASALDALIGRYWVALVRFSSGYAADPDVAEDVAQETFVRVWERRSAWLPTGSVASYLYSIARNIALNRKRRRATHADSADALRRRSERRRTPSPLEDVEAGELRDTVASALEALPDRRREVFRLSRFEGLSYLEIAEVLDISPRTVANHMSAALSDLRESLGPLLRDGPGPSALSKG